ncbi:MAG TPA: PfkB family carbohydrate kinase [Gaiellaceae bacterium]|nr:PfkB family carbohydrate kinase [Gaiellaceae bacterium]
MSLTAVGSIAFDSVRTPFGERDRMLGGSAVHFSLAASFFTDVRVVGPVGADFGDEELGVLEGRGVITDDIERVSGGETFFWRGHYEYDMNVAHTDDTQLNVFADFDPKLSEGSQNAEILFLGNIQPALQQRVRESSKAEFAGLDSMNFWLDNEREALVRAIGTVDCLLLNDAEIRELTGEPNLARAARAAMEMGPDVVVAKRGEYGAALFSSDDYFAIPGYLLEDVRDPTGAGDCFAGGFLGYLDSRRAAGDSVLDHGVLRQAMAYGSVLASFNVEDFGTDRMQSLTREQIDERLREFRRITTFEVEAPS